MLDRKESGTYSYILTLEYMIHKIPSKLCPRRPGDATAVYASTKKAEKEPGWK